MTDTFPIYHPTINIEQVKEFLLSLKQQGLNITTGRPTVADGYAIELGPNLWIGIKPHPHEKGYWCLTNMLGRVSGGKGTINELMTAFYQQCAVFNISLSTPLQEIHTESNKPLSTWVQLSSLIGIAKIIAIYDPYLDNKGIANLCDLVSIGTKIDSNLKLLTFADKNKKRHLTKNWIDKFNQEFNVSAKCKIAKVARHYRLIFLDNDRCVETGFSLNKEQDGNPRIVSLAPNKTKFDQDWEEATDL